MTEPKRLYIDDEVNADWVKGVWDLPVDPRRFVQWLSRRAHSTLNDDIAREWRRFQQLDVYRAMPTETRNGVIRLLESGTSGPIA